MNKKKLIAIISTVVVIVVAAVLVFNLICFHDWQDATCQAPITCSKCGETQGDILEHEWVEANCTEPKHCINCGFTEGESLGHSIKEMKTTKDTSCSAEGERTGFCDRCKKECVEKIKKLPHTKSVWTVKNDCVFNPDGTVKPGTEVIVCTVCNEEIKTRGLTMDLTLSQKNAVICAYDEVNFWHCGPDFLINTVLVEFNDFATSDAKVAVSHMDIDWDEQAVLYAKDNCEGTSKASLTDDLRHYGFNETQIGKALKAVGY